MTSYAKVASSSKKAFQGQTGFVCQSGFQLQKGLLEANRTLNPSCLTDRHFVKCLFSGYCKDLASFACFSAPLKAFQKYLGEVTENCQKMPGLKGSFLGAKPQMSVYVKKQEVSKRTRFPA